MMVGHVWRIKNNKIKKAASQPLLNSFEIITGERSEIYMHMGQSEISSLSLSIYIETENLPTMKGIPSLMVQ